VVIGTNHWAHGRVAIVLSGSTIQTWKNSGNQCKARGAKLVSVTLEQCYAPSFAAKREMKD